MKRIRRRLGQETPAIAHDVFRILVGIYTGAFFVRLLREIPAISSSDGLLDHALIQEAYWFTRVSLFHTGMPDAVFYIADIIGLIGAGCLILGYRVKTAALIILIIEASTYRWNFMVMYLDDAVAHLLIVWLLLLPVGKTLIWKKGGVTKEDWRQWLNERVPAGPALLFLANVCLIYALAGFWKLDSVLWRDGFGLYASVKVHVAVRPYIWNPSHLPFLEFGNMAVLALEPLLPLGLLLRPKNPLRYLSALSVFVFNMFIFFTMGIRFAIAGLTLTIVLFLREEIHQAFVRWKLPDVAEAERPSSESSEAAETPTFRGLPRTTRLATVFLVVLTMGTTRGVPYVGALNEPALATLWMFGIAQDYRLFNWIDRVNWEVDSRLIVEDGGGPGVPGQDTTHIADPPKHLYPTIFRAKLLRAYGHNVRWLIVPPAYNSRLINSIGVRQAAWHCQHADAPLRATLLTDMVRITRENLEDPTVVPFLYADYACTKDALRDGPDDPLRPRLLRGALYLDSIPLEQWPGKGTW